MTEGIVTAISYLCTLIGLGATAAYAATFYLTNYNEIHYAEESSYDDSDLSYTLAIVECCLSGATFIIGVLAFASAGRPNKRAILVAALFFAVALIMEGTFGIIRGWNLGLFGDDMEGTCSDEALSGCPTTRYEAAGHEIEFRAPNGGDCQFWFWDNMDARYTGDQACGGWGATQTPGCSDTIENYMDWTKASSYGWRDDPDAVLSASQGNLVTINKVHNMKLLFELQAEVQNSSSPITTTYSKQPSIAYCWYWGCSDVCQPHRFRVNRWWLISSVSLCVLHLICMTMSLVVWRRTPSDDAKEKAGLPVTIPFEGNEFQVPELGRRKRRLLQNPSGLQF